jgi:hypoxanthine-DNA glycosylase
MQRLQQHPFDPIVFADTRILILGTFPSFDSFDRGFYYSHPRNAFWPILSDLSGYPAMTREQKIWLLKQMGWGLWDMVESCHRKNSLDSSLRDIKVNDIESLLKRYENIEKILFTGRKAEKVFESSFGYLDIARKALPSPSPAYASMSRDEKMEIYRIELGVPKRGEVR